MRRADDAGPGPRCAALLEELRGEFPRLVLVWKDGDALSRAIDVALRAVTFGGQAAYATRYVTTLGERIYLPPDFWARGDDACAIVLRHEAVHLRQFRRLGWIPMAALYLLPVLPVGLAYGRASLEWEAYRETLRATHELLGPEAARDPALRAHIVAQFTSAAYGWMWPFPSQVERWIDEALSELDPRVP